QRILFGTGLVAFEVANCLMGKPYGLQIDGFMVSEQREHPAQVMGIPVYDLMSAEGVIEKEAAVVVATMEKHLPSIKEALEVHGYRHIIPMTFESDLWSLIQGNAYRELRLLQGFPYRTLEEELKKPTDALKSSKKKVHIYTVRSHMDKPLMEDLSQYSWEIPIQAGAALTDCRICAVRDDTGEHISYKNRQYCELTALYWIWKNDRADYAGLCHYRRHFELSEEIVRCLTDSDIDVVLTLPILNFSSVREVYRHDHVEEDWDRMLEAIRILSPAYMPEAVELQNGNFYYGYNMFIARRRIFDDYCAWLFPLLEYCEDRCGQKADKYQERYIGFLAERLLTVYMKHHEAGLKIVHARKHFVRS
ncbi:MAG TPA: hypothetical protein DD414_12870, partial [Lachnospiraceae bacterium]|nr:hypothetical protein [Lachnospiraceae bacterium]